MKAGKEFWGMKYPFKECTRPKLFKLGRCLECSVRDFCETKEKMSYENRTSKNNNGVKYDPLKQKGQIKVK